MDEVVEVRGPASVTTWMCRLCRAPTPFARDCRGGATGVANLVLLCRFLMGLPILVLSRAADPA